MSFRCNSEQGNSVEAYSHVIVNPLGSQKIQSTEDIHLYRNNLTALSKTLNLLFLAVKSDIYVYQPSYPTQSLETEPLYVLKGAEVIPGVRTAGYITPCIPHSINSLLVDYLGDEEILVSADDDGYVCLWYTSKLHLRNLEANVDMVCFDMWFDVQESAWGLAIHRDKRLLAVSCNAKVISIFELGQTGMIEGKVPGGLQKPIRIVGHAHNIPFVSFIQGDPSGRWLCATDIGGHVSLLDAEAGLSTYIRPSARMGWTVNLIPENNFKWVPHTAMQSCLSKSPAETSFSDLGVWDQFVDMGDSDEMEIGDDIELENDHDIEENNQDNNNDDGHIGDAIAAPVDTNEQSHEETHEDSDGNLLETQSIPEPIESLQNDATASSGHKPSDAQDTEALQRPLFCGLPPARQRPTPTTLLVHTTEADIFLFNIEVTNENTEGELQFHKLQRHIPPIPRNVMDPFIPHLFGLIRRLNMVQYIPQLSLLVVGRQDGYVVLVRLLRTIIPQMHQEDDSGDEHIKYFVNSELVLPSQTITENNHPVGLAGISVAPLQGWGDRDRRKRGIGETLLPGSPGSIGGRWRLLLVYTNWTILAYELFTSAIGTSVVLA